MQLAEKPSPTALDKTVLEPGMVLSPEPGVQMGPGRSMVHEEHIVMTDDGAELISRRAPSELLVIVGEWQANEETDLRHRYRSQEEIRAPKPHMTDRPMLSHRYCVAL